MKKKKENRTTIVTLDRRRNKSTFILKRWWSTLASFGRIIPPSLIVVVGGGVLLAVFRDDVIPRTVEVIRYQTLLQHTNHCVMQEAVPLRGHLCSNFLCARSLDSSRRCQGLTFVSDEHCNFLFQIPVMATMRSTEAFPVWFILEKHIQLAPPFANCGFVHI